MMPQFDNPFEEAVKVSVSEQATRLAGYLIAFLPVQVTENEREAFGSVMDVMLRAFPWVLDVPGIKVKLV